MSIPCTGSGSRLNNSSRSGSGSPFWFTVLVHRSGSPFWFTVLVHRSGSPFWFTVLVHRSGSPFWFSILSIPRQPIDIIFPGLLCPLHVCTEPYGRWLCHSFVKSLALVFFQRPSDLYIEKLSTTVSLNQHHIHLIYGSHYPLKWTEPQSCLVYRQLSNTTVYNKGRDPAGLQASSAKQRRQKARCC